MCVDVCVLWHRMTGWYGWVDRFSVGVGGWTVIRSCGCWGEREAAARVEWLRLGQEAGRIAGLIEECRREIERLAIAREVLSGLVTVSAPPVPAAPDLKPVEGFADQLLAVLAEAGRPVRCREVVAVMGLDPSVARHGERVRHRLNKLVSAGLVSRGCSPCG
jgi:hypothetical protein